MAKITINGITVDPAAQVHTLTSAALGMADASSSDYLLIQATGPIGPSERAALDAIGVAILEYVPEDTYLCHYPKTDLEAIRKLPFVAALGRICKSSQDRRNCCA